MPVTKVHIEEIVNDSGRETEKESQQTSSSQINCIPAQNPGTNYLLSKQHRETDKLLELIQIPITQLTINVCKSARSPGFFFRLQQSSLD